MLTVGYTQRDGLRIGAENIALPFSSLPAVQNATMSVAATRRPDGSGWTFAGRRHRDARRPGCNGNYIDLRYLDGKITMTTLAQIARGPAAGTLNFTATNSPLDEAGNPVDCPPTATTGLDLDDITVRQQTLDPESLMKSVFDRLAP